MGACTSDTDVTCPSASCIRPRTRASSVTGLGTAPPNEPECRSPSGPWKSTCPSVMPRMPVQIEGTSAAHIPVSLTTTTSQSSRSRRSCSRAAKCGEPDSSSPSTRIFRLTAGEVRPVAARWACRPSRCIRTWPLSSAVPLARSRSPSRVGSNGAVVQSSIGSTGCTSWCPYTRTVGAPGSADGHCANTAGRPAVGQISTVGKPCAVSSAASQSADRATSAAFAGSPLMEGMRSHSTSRARNSSSRSAMCVRTRGSGSVMRRLYDHRRVA